VELKGLIIEVLGVDCNFLFTCYSYDNMRFLKMIKNNYIFFVKIEYLVVKSSVYLRIRIKQYLCCYSLFYSQINNNIWKESF